MHAAWRDVQRAEWAVERASVQREGLRRLAPLAAAVQHAERDLAGAQQRAEASTAVIDRQTRDLARALQADWAGQRSEAAENARIVLAGPGRLGLRLGAVSRAREQLTQWAVAWQPVIPDLPTEHTAIAHYACRADYRPWIEQAITGHARAHAEACHPGHRQHLAARDTARGHLDQATRGYRAVAEPLGLYGPAAEPADIRARLADLDQALADTHTRLRRAEQRVARLEADPAITAQPAGFLTEARARWQQYPDTSITRPAPGVSVADARRLVHDAAARSQPHPAPDYPRPEHSPGRGIGR